MVDGQAQGSGARAGLRDTGGRTHLLITDGTTESVVARSGGDNAALLGSDGESRTCATTAPLLQVHAATGW